MNLRAMDGIQRFCVCVCVSVCACVHGSHMVYPAVGQVEAVSFLHYYLVPRHRCEIRVGRHVHSKVRHRKLNRYVILSLGVCTRIYLHRKEMGTYKC